MQKVINACQCPKSAVQYNQESLEQTSITCTCEYTYMHFYVYGKKLQFCRALEASILGAARKENCSSTTNREAYHCVMRTKKQNIKTNLVHTCDIISSSGSMKVSANATLAVRSVPNTTSLFCKRLQASKASALHEKSKKANPRFIPSLFKSSTSVKSSYLSTP